MKSKLLLSLWLLGAVLYTGSTVFLAYAVLGGIGGSHVADKAKPTTVTAGAECQKPSADSGETHAAQTAATQPEKPAAPHSSPKPASGEVANRDATPLPGKGMDEAQSAASPEAAQGPEQPAPDADDADQDQAGIDPDQAGAGQGQAGSDQEPAGADQDQAAVDPNQPEGEWVHVVAGTADLRSEPSLQSSLVYALPAGWQVRVISRQPGWVQVQDANSGAAGWVEATALAPNAGPGEQPAPGYDADGNGYRDPYRSADEGYAEDQRWRRRPRGGEFADFLRRALGGF